jgi:hypothetical protein
VELALESSKMCSILRESSVKTSKKGWLQEECAGKFRPGVEVVTRDWGSGL